MPWKSCGRAVMSVKGCASRHIPMRTPLCAPVCKPTHKPRFKSPRTAPAPCTQPHMQGRGHGVVMFLAAKGHSWNFRTVLCSPPIPLTHTPCRCPWHKQHLGLRPAAGRGLSVVVPVVPIRAELQLEGSDEGIPSPGPLYHHPCWGRYGTCWHAAACSGTTTGAVPTVWQCRIHMACSTHQ